MDDFVAYPVRLTFGKVKSMESSAPLGLIRDRKRHDRPLAWMVKERKNQLSGVQHDSSGTDRIPPLVVPHLISRSPINKQLVAGVQSVRMNRRQCDRTFPWRGQTQSHHRFAEAALHHNIGMFAPQQRKSDIDFPTVHRIIQLPRMGSNHLQVHAWLMSAQRLVKLRQ